MVFITIVTGAYKPTYNWGASHCMEHHHFQWVDHLFRLGHFQQLCNKLPEGHGLELETTDPIMTGMHIQETTDLT